MRFWTQTAKDGQKVYKEKSVHELRVCVRDFILLLLLLHDMDVSCHRPFLPGTSLEPAVIPTAHASSFTLQYFPYYVCCSKYSCLL